MLEIKHLVWWCDEDSKNKTSVYSQKLTHGEQAETLFCRQSCSLALLPFYHSAKNLLHKSKGLAAAEAYQELKGKESTQ